MAEQIEATQSDFIKAVNGWKQSVSIMRRLRTGLQFTIDEINTHNGAIPANIEKAKQFEEACAALRTADAYLRTMGQAVYGIGP